MTKTWYQVAPFVFASAVAGNASAQPAPDAPPQGEPPPAEPPAQTTPAPPQTMAPPTQYQYPSEPPPPATVQYEPPPSPLAVPASQRTDVGKFMVGLSWSVGFPVGSVHGFTSDVSAAGYEFQFRYWFHPRFSLGATADWQSFSDTRPQTTYALPNGAVTGTTYNRVGAGSLRVRGDFYFMDRGVVRPYAGANVGFGWSSFEANAADFVSTDTKNSIVLGAELGALFAFAYDTPRLMLSVRYSAQPSADFLSVSDVQAITLQLGVASPAI